MLCLCWVHSRVSHFDETHRSSVDAEESVRSQIARTRNATDDNDFVDVNVTITSERFASDLCHWVLRELPTV